MLNKIRERRSLSSGSLRGTAIAGLDTTEAGGLRTTLMDAVEAATKRSREPGQQAMKSDER